MQVFLCGSEYVLTWQLNGYPGLAMGKSPCRMRRCDDIGIHDIRLKFVYSEVKRKNNSHFLNFIALLLHEFQVFCWFHPPAGTAAVTKDFLNMRH